MVPYIAALVILVVVIRGVVYLIQNRPKVESQAGADRAPAGRVLAAFVSGILFTNAVPHFVHGVSGETFPAPLASLLATPFLQHLSNMIWGFINIVLGYTLFVIGRVSSPGRLNKFVFFAGVLGMGIFLVAIFSR